MTESFIHAENGLYSYPINCPACQESPEAFPDETLAANCQICHGLGEITLQLTQEELSEIYREYLGLAGDESSGCPYMNGQTVSSDTAICPFTGAVKVSK